MGITCKTQTNNWASVTLSQSDSSEASYFLLKNVLKCLTTHNIEKIRHDIRVHIPIFYESGPIQFT